MRNTNYWYGAVVSYSGRVNGHIGQLSQIQQCKSLRERTRWQEIKGNMGRGPGLRPPASRSQWSL